MKYFPKYSGFERDGQNIGHQCYFSVLDLVVEVSSRKTEIVIEREGIMEIRKTMWVYQALES